MFKLYEPDLLFLGFAASTWLAIFLSPLTPTIAGGIVGFSPLFGFNYFLYLGAALVVLFATACGLSAITLQSNSSLAVFGGFCGALPFAVFLLAPGFLRAFIERRVHLYSRAPPYQLAAAGALAMASSASATAR